MKKQRILPLLMSVMGITTAHAQLVFGSGLGTLNAPAPDFVNYRVTLYGTGTLGVLTRTSGSITDYYQEISTGLGFDFDSGRWDGRLSFENAFGGGHYTHNSDFARGTVFDHDWSINVGYRVTGRLRAGVDIDDQDSALQLSSSLLSDDLPALGNNPPINFQERRRHALLSVRYSVPCSYWGEVAAGPLVGDGSVQLGSGTQLSIPLTPRGYVVRGELGKRYKTDSVKASGEMDQAFDRTGLSAPETTSGMSRDDEALNELTLEWARDWHREGSLGIRYVNASSSQSLYAFDPNIDGLGITGLPSGTTANAVGQFHSRRAELGAIWQMPGRTWDLSYRQVLLPADLSGSYSAQYLFFGASEYGSVNYNHVNLGVLSVAHRFKLGPCSATVTLQQIIPYALSQAQTSTSSSIKSGPSESTLGGTTLGFYLSFGK